MVGDNLAFSPDGGLLGSGSVEGYLGLYRTADQSPVTAVAAAPSLVSGSGGIYDLAFSPDGRLLASADGDGHTRACGTAPTWRGSALLSLP